MDIKNSEVHELTLILHRIKDETISNEKAKRLAAPVIDMIEQGKFNKQSPLSVCNR